MSGHTQCYGPPPVASSKTLVEVIEGRGFYYEIIKNPDYEEPKKSKDEENDDSNGTVIILDDKLFLSSSSTSSYSSSASASALSSLTQLLSTSDVSTVTTNFIKDDDTISTVTLSDFSSSEHHDGDADVWMIGDSSPSNDEEANVETDKPEGVICFVEKSKIDAPTKEKNQGGASSSSNANKEYPDNGLSSIYSGKKEETAIATATATTNSTIVKVSRPPPGFPASLLPPPPPPGFLRMKYLKEQKVLAAAVPAGVQRDEEQQPSSRFLPPRGFLRMKFLKEQKLAREQQQLLQEQQYDMKKCVHLASTVTTATTTRKTLYNDRSNNQKSSLLPFVIGPLGRPVVTKAFVHDAVLAQQNSVPSASASTASEEIYGTGLANFLGLIGYRQTTKTSASLFNYTTSDKFTPKVSLTILNQKAGWKPPQYRSEVVQDPTTERITAVLHKATVVTVVPKYNTNQNKQQRRFPATLSAELEGHAHVTHHPDDDWLELISVGMATNKKHAAQLAALDQLVLVHETLGVDCSLPNWQEWLRPIHDNENYEEQIESLKKEHHAAFEKMKTSKDTAFDEMKKMKDAAFEKMETSKDETIQALKKAMAMMTQSTKKS